MMLNSAFCMVLCGAALIALANRARRWVLISSVVVVVFAVSTLVLYYFGWSYGFDEWLTQGKWLVAVAPRATGPSNTVVALSLLGLAIGALGLDRKTHGLVLAVSGVVLAFALLPLVRLLGAMGPAVAYQGMSVPTVCSLLVLASALLKWCHAANQAAGRGSVPLFSAAFGMLISVGVVTDQSNDELREANRRVAHSQQIRVQVTYLVSEVARLESSARGYALTGMDSFRSRDSVHRGEVRRMVAQLLDLTNDNPGQHAQVRQMVELVREKFVQVAALEQAREKGEIAAAAEYLRRLQGEQTSRLVQLADTIHAEENRFLTEHEMHLAGVERDLRAVQTIGSVLALGLLGAAALTASRAAMERTRAEAEEKQAHSLTTAALESTADGLLVVDLSGRIVTFNRHFVEIWRLPDSVLAAREDTAALAWVIDQVKEPQHFTAKIKELYNAPEQESFDTLEFKDGRIVERYSRPQRINERVVGRVWSFRDVTQRRASERALRESEARFRTLSSAAFEGIVISEHGRVLDANDQALAMLNVGRAELIGRAVLDFVAPDSRAMVAEAVSAGEEKVYEHQLQRKDGTVFTAEANARAMQFGGRRVRITALRDITERKQVEKEKGIEKKVLESLARGGPLPEILTGFVLAYEELLPGMRGSVLLLDLDGRHLRHGAAPHLPPDYCQAIDGVEIGPQVGSCGTAAYTRKSTMVEDIAGDPLWSDFKNLALMHGLSACWSVPIQGAADRVLGTFAFYSDVPRAALPGEMALLERGAQLASLAIERQQTDSALEKMRFSVDRAGDSIFWIGRDGSILYANKAACTDRGYSSEELLGMKIFDLDADYQPGVWRLHFEELKSRGTITLETRHRTKEGRVFPIEVNANYVSIDGQEFNFATVRDISARQQAEAERLGLEGQLRQSQKMEAIGTLARGIAHDFNNILAGIYGFTSLAQTAAKGNRELQEYLHEISRAGNRAAGLVRQILAFSRAQGGDQTHAPVQLGGVVLEVVKLLRAARPSTIELTTELAPDLPAVLGNESQLHQVLMNLGTNALQAMADRGGRLSIRLDLVDVDEALVQALPDLQPGSCLRLTVSDTGHGIDAAIQQRVFEPFFTTKGPGEGSGLGLSVVYGIVRHHHGGIRLTSEVGRGTTFEIFLPAAAAQPPPEPAAVATAPGGHGERILFVDDEESIARVVKLALSQLGYLVESETAVMAALARLEREPQGFDLVVSDQTMPGVTGLEFSERVRQVRPDLPVVLASGYSAALTAESIQAAGVREVLAKPYSMEDLARAIRRHLRPTRSN